MGGTVTPRPRCTLAVVKVASRCNLNCSYCYVYNLGDTSYLRQPAVMSTATVDALLQRVAEHCARHRLRTFSFAFHGGEPLLAGSSFFRYFVDRAAAVVGKRTRIKYFVQTNGTLMDDEWCSVLRELNITLGISLDGPPDVNDRWRVDHAGKGSYDRTLAGWNRSKAAGLDPGLLMVMDVGANPRIVFEHVCALEPRFVDFLFPDANYERLPPQYANDDQSTPYGDWLLEIFQLWMRDDSARFRIRLFERIIHGLLGIPGKSDALGPGRNEVLVVESDGSIEPVDVLKVCGEGATRTEFNVHRSTFDEAFRHPLIELYHLSNQRLCETCQRCLVKQVCAGGYLPHRYRERNGFDNPSVYCRDLMRLISGIQNWVCASLPSDIAEQQRVVALSFAQARAAIAVSSESATASRRE